MVHIRTLGNLLLVLRFQGLQNQRVGRMTIALFLAFFTIVRWVKTITGILMLACIACVSRSPQQSKGRRSGLAGTLYGFRYIIIVIILLAWMDWS